MYETRGTRLLPWPAFVRRAGRHFLVGMALLLFSVGMGTIGYRVTGRELGWLDALLNASMILTGIGPVDRMTSVAGKLFAAAYALYSGVAFLGVMGILVAPWVHRLLHRFHVEDPDPQAS